MVGNRRPPGSLKTPSMYNNTCPVAVRADAVEVAWCQHGRPTSCSRFTNALAALSACWACAELQLRHNRLGRCFQGLPGRAARSCPVALLLHCGPGLQQQRLMHLHILPAGALSPHLWPAHTGMQLPSAEHLLNIKAWGLCSGPAGGDSALLGHGVQQRQPAGVLPGQLRQHHGCSCAAIAGDLYLLRNRTSCSLACLSRLPARLLTRDYSCANTAADRHSCQFAVCWGDRRYGFISPHKCTEQYIEMSFAGGANQ